MKNPEIVFERLVAAIVASYDNVSVLTGRGLDAGGGTAASTFLGCFGDTTVDLAAGLVVAAGKEVYEGVLKAGTRGTWSGEEIPGEFLGIAVSESAIVEGMTVYADGHVGPVVAAEVGSDHVVVDGWITDGFIDSISYNQNPSSGGIPVYALAQSASTMYQDAAEVLRYDENSGDIYVLLNGLYEGIQIGDRVVFKYEGLRVAFSVSDVDTIDAKVQEVDAKALLVPATRIKLEKSAFLTFLDPEKIRIWFDARRAGTLERIPRKTVTKLDFVNIARPVTLSPNATLPAQDTFIVIQDAEGTTLRAKGGGQGSSDNPQIMITELLEEFDGELVKPITFLWGLTKVTRGQTVNREIIGSGDATQRWQSFRLAKSPLTYVADPFTPGGRRPEIDVYVNGIKWRRAQSFYKATPQDEIYVLRHDAEHNTFIQFGDGELGKRLPTGANNVVATYRFGVGGNVEANAINKLVRPIRGVTSVFNPLPATGGEDPPTEAEAREKAIASTRVLGHLVSVVDFEVEAARYGGVVRAKALWGWDQAADDAVVKVWIICADEGDPSADLRTYLMNMAEPEVRVEVSKATKYVGELAIDLDLDPNYLPEDVHAAVDARLFDEFEGLLAPRNVPIGSAFYRSELYAAIHEIEGVRSVLGLLVDGSPMPTRILLQEGQYLALAYPDAG